MKKPLSEMTKEELWKLFPIELTPHRDCWNLWYREEKKRLSELFSRTDGIRLHHIGSTAVNTIWAKPIVDILMEIPSGYLMGEIKKILTLNGYICMSEEPERLSFNRGYTPDGFSEKVFHLHLRFSGDNSELYFRDYLIEHPDVANEYERMKLGLWKQYEYNRDAYTNAKTEFIKLYTEKAKKEYAGRY